MADNENMDRLEGQEVQDATAEALEGDEVVADEMQVIKEELAESVEA